MASRKQRAPAAAKPPAAHKATGLRQGLANYGDAGFSLFLRKAFIKAGGYSDDALDRPIVGITNTFSDYNPCHGNVPDLIEAENLGRQVAVDSILVDAKGKTRRTWEEIARRTGGRSVVVDL